VLLNGSSFTSNGRYSVKILFEVSAFFFVVIKLENKLHK
jgi:hypothetical protein